MSAENEEHLSSLIDGELDTDASRFLLRRLQGSEELKQRWSRHSLASDLLRRRAVLPASADFADRVAAALLADAQGVAVSNPGRAWLRYAGGAALAASVAVVAMSLVPPHSSPDAPALTSSGSPTQAPAPRTEFVASAPRAPAMAAAQPAAANYSPVQGGPVMPTMTLAQGYPAAVYPQLRVPAMQQQDYVIVPLVLRDSAEMPVSPEPPAADQQPDR